MPTLTVPAPPVQSIEKQNYHVAKISAQQRASLRVAELAGPSVLLAFAKEEQRKRDARADLTIRLTACIGYQLFRPAGVRFATHIVHA